MRVGKTWLELQCSTAALGCRREVPLSFQDETEAVVRLRKIRLELQRPTTALGLILLTTALPRVDKIAYILLLVWAIPFPPFVQIPKYGVFEDAIMFLIGIYSLILLWKYWKAETPGR